jgi:DNA-directed RNA polymerase sigma subunit (sigma70/sigma32)
MTPETAYAARLSYQGVSYLDAPVNNSSAAGEGYMTVGDMLADTVGVPAELLEPSDFERARREETRTKVHAVLDRMGKQQQTVLKALTGIDPVGYYGNENDDELAADYGIPRHRVMVIRSLGKTRFAALWNEAEEAAA